MRAGILRILPISRAGGTPLPMAGRLTQLAKIFPVIYTTALRRLPSSSDCHPPLIKPPSIGMRQRRGASQKTAEERFNMLARGWLAYPVTPVAHATTAEERL